MAHQSRWLLEKRVLLIVYEGDIDRAEMQQLNRELEIYLTEGQSPIHIISDNRAMGDIELTLNIVRETFGVMKRKGWGWVVLVAVPPLVRFFANIFSIQFGLSIKSVETMEKAWELLEGHDKSLKRSNG